jgi:hypothetical protein
VVALSPHRPLPPQPQARTNLLIQTIQRKHTQQTRFRRRQYQQRRLALHQNLTTLHRTPIHQAIRRLLRRCLPIPPGGYPPHTTRPRCLPQTMLNLYPPQTMPGLHPQQSRIHQAQHRQVRSTQSLPLSNQRRDYHSTRRELQYHQPTTLQSHRSRLSPQMLRQRSPQTHPPAQPQLLRQQKWRSRNSLGHCRRSRHFFYVSCFMIVSTTLLASWQRKKEPSRQHSMLARFP